MATDIKNDASLGVSLRAYYDFKANSNDLTGNGYNGSDQNSPSYANESLGLTAASSQYTLLPNAAINWGTNVITINVWVKMSGTQDLYAFLMVARTGQGLNLYWYRSGTTLTFSKPNVADCNYVSWSPTNDVWYMVTAVGRSGATYMETYINGVSVATNANSSNFVAPSTDTIPVGGYKSGGSMVAGWYHNGEIKHLGIWDKSLTTTDITNLYNGGTPLPYEAASGTNMKINIGDTWKTVSGIKINVGDSWKTVSGAKVNIGDTWKTIF